MLPDLDASTAWDERLRQVAADPVAIERAIFAARRLLETSSDPGERSRLHGYLGNAARLLGRDADAVAELGTSLDIARGLGDSELETVATIRLAEAHRCFDRLEAAERLLRRALASGHRRDFALQHLGKTLLDADRPHDAVRALEEALELRRAGGDPALVASTEHALAVARARVG